VTSSSESAGTRVWRELRRRKRAVFGLWFIGVLGALALAADLIANDKPYYMKLDGHGYFPVAIDYGVWLGLRQWPEALVNQRQLPPALWIASAVTFALFVLARLLGH